jgi:poly(3-hydroxyalkanoate) synthetase
MPVAALVGEQRGALPAAASQARGYLDGRARPGCSRFAQARGGYIAFMVRSPGNPKARFQVSATNPSHPRDWLKVTETLPGSGRPDRSSRLACPVLLRAAAVREPGSSQSRPMEPAPCLYVMDL